MPAAKPFRSERVCFANCVSGGMKAPPTPELRSGRIDGGYAPNSQKKLSKLNEKFCVVLKLPL